jgi:hypothetical protein
MEITIKIEKTGIAVYDDGRCVLQGSSAEEADRLARELLNRDLARPRV